MGSIGRQQKLHAVCIPYPAQGHINPMMKLAKQLHFRGFYITFVNTEYNHKRLLRSRGSDSLKGLEDFRFQTIPDGLPPSDHDETQHIPSLCESTSKTCALPFKNLLLGMTDAPPVTCIISDGVMSFTQSVAKELKISNFVFWTTSACGFLGYVCCKKLREIGIFPLKDESCLTNGYLDTKIDGIKGMEDIRLKDLPSFFRTTDPNDLMCNFVINETERCHHAPAIILNTFEALEKEVLEELNSRFPKIYTVGPLPLVSKFDELASIGSNLWKEDITCLHWLDLQKPNSVVYVNFGSITVMTHEQLREFGWGLANSKHPFLWIIRSDLVKGERAIFPKEFVEEIEGRGMISLWCPQEKVLQHESIGGFLTHCGWNSTLESICNGVPMICWPFFAEQQTNCRHSCVHWKIGMEIDSDVKREEVEALITELIQGEKGKEMKRNAMKWKREAKAAASKDGPSSSNIDRFVQEMILSPLKEDNHSL